MEWIIAVLLLVVLLLLALIRLPIAFSLGVTGVLGMYLVWGGMASFPIVARTSFTTAANFLLGAIPPFIFMAEIIVFTGISEKAFAAIERLFGRVRGSLAYSSVVATTMFGAVTGFSPATCATIGSIAIPEMIKRGYPKGLSVGVIGGGAALAILIPPSILMVLYGGLADVSIGRLFVAGLFPGILSAVLFMVYIRVVDYRCQGLPYGKAEANFLDRIRGLFGLLPIGCLFVLVLGVIYLGICTPTEAASIGALGALIMAAFYRKLTFSNLKKATINTLVINSMIFAILFGATLFTQALSYMQIPAKLAMAAVNAPVNRWVVLSLIMILVLFLGSFLDCASILSIVVPIFIPVIIALHFDPLWFGILLMINMEVATLTPPVGLNLYVLKGILPADFSMGMIFEGCIAFTLLHILTMVIVMIVPGIATWLPSLMK